jgi:monovalent cation:H+ antiporter, CPA1 family
MPSVTQAPNAGWPSDMGAVFVLLFVLATIVAIGASRLRVAYPVALVVAGLVLGSLNVVTAPRLTQQFLFATALPGLVFEAAFNLRVAELRRNWRTLFLLSVPGVAIAIALTVLLAPVLLSVFGAPIAGFAAPLVIFAVLISATDPVAVLALFRRLGVPRRLAVLVEAESLLNDATAIVFFLAALALLTGSTNSAPGAALGITGRVVVGLAGGALIGLVVGGAVALVIARVDDPMVEITLTVVAAYGSFAAAQQLGLSGVLATVAAGVLCGHDVARRGMTATTRVAVGTFWEYGAFALNSIVFLLIGFEVHFQALLIAWRPIVAAFLAVLIARAIVVGAVTALVRPTGERISWQWAAVLTWGGFRGALSMVLALALPTTMPHRELLITITFGVVTLSLLGQGLSIPGVLHGLRVVEPREPGRAFDTAREEFRAARAAVEELDYLADAGVIPGRVEVYLRRRYGPRLERARRKLQEVVATADEAARADRHGSAAGKSPSRTDSADDLSTAADAGSRAAMDETVRQVERYLLDVERDRLDDALRAGHLPVDAYHELIADLDARRAALILSGP